MDLAKVDLVPLATALAGVVAGGLISELRSALQGARERRRALRMLLFELLEIRWRVRGRDPALLLRAVDAILGAEVFKALTTAPNSAENRGMLETLSGAARAVGSKATTGEAYLSAVTALAPHDPVLAYTLRGLERFEDLDHELATYFATVLAKAGEAGVAADASEMKRVQSATLATTYRAALTALRHDVERVAWKLGLWERVQVRQVLARQDDPATEEGEAMVAEFVAELQRSMHR